MQASTSLMVPREQLSRVAGMNQTLQGIMSIVTPTLGAMLLALVPLPTILAIDIATAALAVGPLFFYSIPQPEGAGDGEAQGGRKAAWWGVLGDVAAGFRLIWDWRWLRTIALGCTAANLVLSPAYSLTPLVVTTHFGGGAMELGWVNSALGIGTVVGGVVLSAWGGFRRRIQTMMLGVVFLAAGPLIVGLAPARWLWLAAAGMWVGGVGGPIFNGPLTALLQTTVKPEMQGRVLTATNSMYSLASPLGLAIAGPVADAIGPQMWFVLAGASCIVVGLIIVGTPGMWTMDETAAAAAPAARLAEGE
jgi:DHA3 family macrolide efflux protein-like MFS transporter